MSDKAATTRNDKSKTGAISRAELEPMLDREPPEKGSPVLIMPTGDTSKTGAFPIISQSEEADEDSSRDADTAAGK